MSVAGEKWERMPDGSYNEPPNVEKPGEMMIDEYMEGIENREPCALEEKLKESGKVKYPGKAEVETHEIGDWKVDLYNDGRVDVYYKQYSVFNERDDLLEVVKSLLAIAIIVKRKKEGVCGFRDAAEKEAQEALGQLDADKD